MEVTITKPVTVNVKTLEAYLGDRFKPENLTFYDSNANDEVFGSVKELLDKFPSLERNKEVCLVIDVDNGEIINWPKGYSCEFYDIKLVDSGKYRLYDNENNLIHEYDGYVPKILDVCGGGYGDYLEFAVDANGIIENWECTDELIESFINEE